MLLQVAEKRWKKLRGFRTPELIVSGKKFKDRLLIEDLSTENAAYLTPHLTITRKNHNHSPKEGDMLLRRNAIAILLCLCITSLTCPVWAQGNSMSDEDFFKELMICSDKGCEKFQYVYGVAYIKGLGKVHQDVKKGILLLKQAARKGFELAQFELTEIYRNGEYVKKNIAESNSWLRYSAKNGSISSQFALGMYLLYGRSNLKKDVKKGMYWLEKSAEQGEAAAQYALGLEYAINKNVPVDREKSLYWMRKAAAQGFQKAIDLLKQ